MAIRGKVVLIVGAPLLGLLAVLSTLDFLRLRSSTMERTRDQLLAQAHAEAEAVQARLLAIDRAGAAIRNTLEHQPGLSDAEIYTVLAAQVEVTPNLVAALVAFAPGTRPPLAFGPEPEPDIPLDERINPFAAAESAVAVGDFEPVVFNAGRVSVGGVGAPRTDLRRALVGALPGGQAALALARTLAATGTSTWLPPIGSPVAALSRASGAPTVLPCAFSFAGPSNGPSPGRGVIVLLADTGELTRPATRPRPGVSSSLLFTREAVTVRADEVGGPFDPVAVLDAEILESPGDDLRERITRGSSGSGTLVKASGTRLLAGWVMLAGSEVNPSPYLPPPYLPPPAAATGDAPPAAAESVGMPWRCVVLSDPMILMPEIYRETRDRVFLGALAVSLLTGIVAAVAPGLLRPIRNRSGPGGAGFLDLGEDEPQRAPSPQGHAAAPDSLSALDPLAAITPDGHPKGGGPAGAAGGSTPLSVAGDRSGPSDELIARSIQISLLPVAFPKRPEFDLFAIAVPAQRVGGDCYDFFAVGPDAVAVMVADVSGKGVGAAMFMSATRTMVREIASASGNSPGAALARASDLLIDANPELLFVTVFLAYYNVRTGVLTYANAGHPSPMLIRSGGPVTPLGRATGTIMGAFPGMRIDDREALLQPGDRLVIVSDGVLEAKSASGSFLGSEGLAALCERHRALKCESFCREVMAAVEHHQSGVLHDDATILALRRLK